MKYKYIDAEKLIAEINNRLMSVNLEELGNFGCHRVWAYNDVKDLITSLQQEQPVTKEPISHLEHWLAFFGCPEENIEKCATQIAQGYGAIRYLEGVQRGAEAVNELAKQEQPEVELEKEINNYHITKKPHVWFHTLDEIARHFYELGLNARK